MGVMGSLQRLRARLSSWYKQPAQRRRRLTEITGEITGKMIGTETKPVVTIKAKESESFAEFLIRDLLPTLPVPEKRLLVECGDAILEYIALCRVSPPNLPPETLQRMMELGLRHVRICRAVGIPWTPKHHLFIHMIYQSREAGNPTTFHTFLDESLNRTLAAIARSAYASVWEWRILANFEQLQPQDRGFIG